MTVNEPKCVSLKRLGAKHIEKLLAKKSRQEELEFWRKRTEKLRSLQKQFVT